MPKKRKPSNLGAQWVIASIIGVIFLTWLFTRPPRETEEEKIKREAYLDARQSEYESHREDMLGITELKEKVRQELKASEIPCYKVEISDSKCLWVYTADNGKNRDGLAITLCYTAKRYNVNCVTIVDQNQNALGRSLCK